MEVKHDTWNYKAWNKPGSGMKSKEFYKAFTAGKLGDDAEWFDWLFVYEVYSKISRQKKIIEGISLWSFAILRRSKNGVKESNQVVLIDVLDRIEGIVIAGLEGDVE